MKQAACIPALQEASTTIQQIRRNDDDPHKWATQLGWQKHAARKLRATLQPDHGAQFKKLLCKKLDLRTKIM